MKRRFFLLTDFCAFFIILFFAVAVRRLELNTLIYINNCKVFLFVFAFCTFSLWLFSFYDIKSLRKQRMSYKSLGLAFLLSTFLSVSFFYFLSGRLPLLTPKSILLAVLLLYFAYAYWVRKSYFKLDFAKTNLLFDVILTDAPCSGEGLFRREPDAVNEWSPQNVRFCAERQRQILRDIWPCLKDGGLLIYSTCTFNTYENEENIRWIIEELGADILSVPVLPDWQITGSLLADWPQPVYRFIPGVTRSEGLFMAILRKRGEKNTFATLPSSLRTQLKKYPFLHLLSDGIPQPEIKGREQIPSVAQALSLSAQKADFPRVELPLEEALRYLHRETLKLPGDTPRGFVLVTYHGNPLGFVKNLGDRANNLYPKPWAIRNL